MALKFSFGKLTTPKQWAGIDTATWLSQDLVTATSAHAFEDDSAPPYVPTSPSFTAVALAAVMLAGDPGDIPHAATTPAYEDDSTASTVSTPPVWNVALNIVASNDDPTPTLYGAHEDDSSPPFVPTFIQRSPAFELVGDTADLVSIAVEDDSIQPPILVLTSSRAPLSWVDDEQTPFLFGPHEDDSVLPYTVFISRSVSLELAGDPSDVGQTASTLADDDPGALPLVLVAAPRSPGLELTGDPNDLVSVAFEDDSIPSLIVATPRVFSAWTDDEQTPLLYGVTEYYDECYPIILTPPFTAFASLQQQWYQDEQTPFLFGPYEDDSPPAFWPVPPPLNVAWQFVGDAGDAYGQQPFEDDSIQPPTIVLTASRAPLSWTDDEQTPFLFGLHEDDSVLPYAVLVPRNVAFELPGDPSDLISIAVEDDSIQPPVIVLTTSRSPVACIDDEQAPFLYGVPDYYDQCYPLILTPQFTAFASVQPQWYADDQTPILNGIPEYYDECYPLILTPSFTAFAALVPQWYTDEQTPFLFGAYEDDALAGYVPAALSSLIAAMGVIDPSDLISVAIEDDSSLPTQLVQTSVNAALLALTSDTSEFFSVALEDDSLFSFMPTAAGVNGALISIGDPADVISAPAVMVTDDDLPPTLIPYSSNSPVSVLSTGEQDDIVTTIVASVVDDDSLLFFTPTAPRFNISTLSLNQSYELGVVAATIIEDDYLLPLVQLTFSVFSHTLNIEEDLPRRPIPPPPPPPPAPPRPARSGGGGGGAFYGIPWWLYPKLAEPAEGIRFDVYSQIARATDPNNRDAKKYVDERKEKINREVPLMLRFLAKNLVRGPLDKLYVKPRKPGDTYVPLEEWVLQHSEYKDPDTVAHVVQMLVRQFAELPDEMRGMVGDTAPAAQAVARAEQMLTPSPAVVRIVQSRLDQQMTNIIYGSIAFLVGIALGCVVLAVAAEVQKHAERNPKRVTRKRKKMSKRKRYKRPS